MPAIGCLAYEHHQDVPLGAHSASPSCRPRGGRVRSAGRSSDPPRPLRSTQIAQRPRARGLGRSCDGRREKRFPGLSSSSQRLNTSGTGPKIGANSMLGEIRFVGVAGKVIRQAARCARKCGMGGSNRHREHHKHRKPRGTPHGAMLFADRREVNPRRDWTDRGSDSASELCDPTFPPSSSGSPARFRLSPPSGSR